MEAISFSEISDCCSISWMEVLQPKLTPLMLKDWVTLGPETCGVRVWLEKLAESVEMAL